MRHLPAIVSAYQLPDSRKAASQILTSFLPFLILWTAAYLLVDISVGLALLLTVVNAFFLVRIFIIQHDCGHQSFTASRLANDLIGLFCSVFSFIPYRYWAKSHHFHHGHNGMLWEHRDIGDITVLTVEEYRRRGFWGRLRYRLYRSAPVLFLLGPLWYVLIQNRLPLIRFKGWESARRALLRHNLLLIGVYVVLGLLLGYKALLWVQLPTLVFFGMIAVWFFYVQHQHETTYKAWKDRWDYIRAAIEGSTYYDLPRLFHWLTGNIGYHHIHHLNPLIPNYELARCHREHPLFDRIANRITFGQSLKTVFNHLWDEQQQRMISFYEYYRRYARPRRDAPLMGCSPFSEMEVAGNRSSLPSE